MEAARAASRDGLAAADALLAVKVGPRRFAQVLGAAVGLAGAGLLAGPPRWVRAAYQTDTPQAGTDTVTGHLTVQGNVTVNSRIGIGTSNPGALVEGVGTEGALVVRTTAGDARLMARAEGGTAYLRVEDIGGQVFDLRVPDGSGRLEVVDATSGVVRLAIDANGRVGIGSSFPTSRLLVRTAAQTVEGATVSGTDGHNITVRGSSGQGYSNDIVQAGDAALIYSNGTIGTGALVIAPWAAGTSGMRLDASGNVAIGRVTAEARLHLADGALKIGTRVIADGGGSFYAP